MTRPGGALSAVISPRKPKSKIARRFAANAVPAPFDAEKKILGADDKNNPEDSSFPKLFLFEIRDDDICFSSYNDECGFH